MKTNKKHQKPFHLHVEHFFRHRILLFGVLIFLTVAVCKADSKLLGMFREASAQGINTIGSYMRQETVREPTSFNLTGRIPTISGK